MTDISELVNLRVKYDPITGIFTWKNYGAKTGRIAGTRTGLGYIRIGIAGKDYMAHRLAWLIVHGTWPSNVIDHINGVGTDNRIANLRDVSISDNAKNRRGANTNSKTGLRGITQHQNGYIIRKNAKYVGTCTSLTGAKIMWENANV